MSTARSVLGRAILGRTTLGLAEGNSIPPAFNYTGDLGSAGLGYFVLGGYTSSTTTLTARLTQEVVEILDVYNPIVFATQLTSELFYSPLPDIIMTQLAAEILHIKGPSAVLTQQATEVLDQYTPNIHLTQLVAEVIEVRTSTARLTEFVAEVVDVYNPSIRLTEAATEVLYQYIAPTDINLTTAISVAPTIAHSSTINRIVVSAIVVGQTIAGQIYPQSVTTNITVVPVIVVRNSTIHVSVTNSITVTPSIRVNLDRVESVGTAVTVTQTYRTIPQIINISLQDDIAVSQTIIKNDVINLSVTSNISVSSVVSVYNPVNMQTVTSAISVTQAIAFRNTVVRISVIQPIGATIGAAEHSDVSHQEIIDDIGVDALIVVRNTNVRDDVLSTLTITATIFARSTVIHETVISNIAVTPNIVFFNPNIAVENDVAVTQTIAVRSTGVELSVNSAITVATKVQHSPNIQNVSSNITVDGSTFGTAINFYISPVTFDMFQPVYLSTAVTGGSSNRAISVESDIVVTPTIRINTIDESVNELITVATAITGGVNPRTLSIQDNITVATTVASRLTEVDIAMNQNIRITQIIIAQAKIVPVAVQTTAVVSTVATPSIIPHIKMTQAIVVTPNILAHPDNNHQSITDSITVGQAIRSSPNYQTVVQPIAVASRIRQLNIDLISKITVDQQIGIVRDKLFISKLPITQTLTATRVLNRTIRSDIAVSQTIKDNHDYTRVIVQKLIIPDFSYQLKLDFSDQPISVPVAIGVIVNASLMIIRGQHGAIQLPPPQLGDSDQAIGEMEIRKSMDGTAFSYIQQTDRRKLSYRWLLPHLKIYELRQFVVNSFSDLLTIDNWKGERWAVRITKNPFEFSNQGVWEKDKEYAEVEMEFEGKKLA